MLDAPGRRQRCGAPGGLRRRSLGLDMRWGWDSLPVVPVSRVRLGRGTGLTGRWMVLGRRLPPRLRLRWLRVRLALILVATVLVRSATIVLAFVLPAISIVLAFGFPAILIVGPRPSRAQRGQAQDEQKLAR